MAERLLNAFTVDVEDYFQVSAFENVYPRESWDRIPLRLRDGAREILEILAARGVRGTFFVLGWVARKDPGLIREISAGGHELGCHGDEHRLVYTMSPDSFRSDLRKALRSIEDAAGCRCAMFRAPSFSVTRDSLWALEILAEEGIEIDSSIYPVRHDRYGIPGAPRKPYRPLAGDPDFVEFPPSTVRFLGVTWPCAGGGYLRLYPGALTRIAIGRINRADRSPAVVYVHPWELDPRQPVAPAAKLTNLRHRVNLRQTARRVDNLLEAFRFGPLTAALEGIGGACCLPYHDLSGSAGETVSRGQAMRNV